MNNDTNPDNPIPTNSTKVIYTYNLTIPIDGLSVSVKMPEGAQILSLHGTRMWALVDTNNPEVERKFFVIRTGEPIGDEELGVCIGKIFKPSPCDGSGAVYHVFDCSGIGCASTCGSTTTMQLTPELKKWLRRKVSKELTAERAASTTAIFASAMGQSVVGGLEVEYLEELEKQLQ